MPEGSLEVRIFESISALEQLGWMYPGAGEHSVLSHLAQAEVERGGGNPDQGGPADDPSHDLHKMAIDHRSWCRHIERAAQLSIVQ